MGTQLHPSTANTNVASQRWGAGSQRGEGSQEISGSPVKLNMRVGVQGKEARAERGPGSPRLGGKPAGQQSGSSVEMAFTVEALEPPGKFHHGFQMT